MLESYGWKLLEVDRETPALGNYDDYNEEVADLAPGILMD